MSPGESAFTDGSEGLFSIYLDRTEDEDEKMAERWKADADGILVFVSDLSLFSFSFLSLLEYNMPIDRAVLRRGCHVYWRVHPGPSAQLTGCVGILSREHLPTSR